MEKKQHRAGCVYLLDGASHELVAIEGAQAVVRELTRGPRIYHCADDDGTRRVQLDQLKTAEEIWRSGNGACWNCHSPTHIRITQSADSENVMMVNCDACGITVDEFYKDSGTHEWSPW